MPVLLRAYLVIDQVEEDLITGSNVSGVFTAAGIAPKSILPNIGGVYKYGIPLVIQDKTFVNDSTTPSAARCSGISSRLHSHSENSRR